jgi:signal transduction histidine kinase/CheY-like chemotaxis protein/Tfp pilus assembly protein PilF/HPt (histidine-containing phosphotransfer) domain-containing protein
LADNTPDSLLNLIPEAHDTVKIELYNQLYVYYQDKDSETGLEYLFKSLEITRQLGNPKKTAQILVFIGHVYERRGGFDKSIELYNEALELYQEINDEPGIANALVNLGATYTDKGDFVNAMDATLKALEYFEKTNAKDNIARAHNNIGLIHYYQEDYDKALEHYNTALELRRELGSKEGEALALNNIGIVYYFKNELDKVLDCFFQSLEIYKELDDIRGQVRPLFNIGEIYLEQGRYEDALEYYNKSLVLDKQLGDTSSIAETYSTIGSVYLNQGNYKKALKNQKMALELMETTDFLLGMKTSYLELSQTYQKIGNYKQALNYYKKYTEVHDSLFNKEKVEALADVAAKYETEKKEEEIKLLNKEKQFQEIALEQQKDKARKRLLYIIVFGIGFLIILGYSHVLLRLLKKNREKTDLLTERNHEINQQTEELQAALSMINDQKEELLKANEEIIQTTRAKEMFLANTTHEIRTPVNIIAGFTNLLLNTSINDVQARYLKNIRNSANNLLVMINDILTFSKIEADKLSIESIEFNLREVITGYFESIAISADKKKLDLSYTIDTDIPEILVGDPVRLQQIVSNLIGNAIKFTNKGGKVTMQVEKVKDNSKQVELKFTVNDSGIGIAEDKLDRIFESFSQADKTTSRKYGGTGLGLSIVKKLVELQRGSIAVESKLNEGSTFTFTLPYRKKLLTKAKKKTTEPAIDSSKTKNIKVLVADDNPVNAELITDLFNSYDSSIQVDTADNGQAAINKLKENYYHILLLDILMPVMDGFKTADYIRNKLPQPAKDIPIIALSAFADETQHDKCLEAGMDGYLTKPFEPNQLFAMISNLLGMDKKDDASKEKVKLDNISLTHDFQVIDLNFLLKTYNNQVSKIENILKICLKDVPRQIAKINDSWYDKRFGNLKVAAHSLKTTLNYLGMQDLKEEARIIELSIDQKKDITKIPERIKKITEKWKTAETEIKQALNALV